MLTNTNINLRDYQQTHPSMKPKGLWYGINHSWLDWCRTEMPDFIKPWTFELEINKSNIILINNPQKLNKFIEEFTFDFNGIKFIDWNEITYLAKGIEIQNYYQLKSQFDYIDFPI